MKFIKEIKKYSLLMIAFSIISGVLFIAYPELCIKYMSIAVGAAFIVMGAIAIIGHLINKNSKFTLALGIILAIVGIVICIKYQAIISIIVGILGIVILSTGIFNLVTGIKVLISHLLTGWFTILMSVVEVVFGFIAITKTTSLTEGVVQFIGVALLIYAVLGLVAFIQVRKIYKGTIAEIESTGDIETDAVIIEEVDDN